MNNKIAKTENLDDIDRILKANKEDHYNFHKEVFYTVSTGSLNFDTWLGGGLGTGIHRFIGPMEAGKTSAALEIARNFQHQFPDNSMVIYFKSEGRLSEQVKERCGVDFSREKFRCIESNVYEFIVDTILTLISDNENDTKYFFIVDSLDSLMPREELKKTMGDPTKVAGGASLASIACKKLGLPMNKLGHILIFISQVREKDFKISQYQASTARDNTLATGGNALLHAPNWILQFEKKNKSTDLIKENQKEQVSESNKILGHWVKVTIHKSTNETTGESFRYPIKRGSKNEPSIWISYELLSCLKKYNLISMSGAWISISENLREDLKEIQIPEKIHGETKLLAYLEENKIARDAILDYIKGAIM